MHNMRTPFLLATLVSVLLTAGCALLPEPAEPPVATDCAKPERPSQPALQALVPGRPLLAQVWGCTDKRTVVTYPQPDGLRVIERGCQRVLPAVATASGVRHEDAELLFWAKGTEAQMQRKPGPAIFCREFRSASVIEDARVRGISFRGQGNQPPWLVEVGPGNRVALLHGAPATSLVFPRLASITDDASATTVYTGKAGGNSVSVKVTEQPCIDNISGTRYPGSIELRLDGVLSKGCGIPLKP